jgi:serine/threonine protein kinase
LAVKVQDSKERRNSVCGTPNYLAPEQIEAHNFGGHSFEVDIWAIGIITFVLLVGRPPFESPSIEETYDKIIENQIDFSAFP